ncbi:MAG: aldo/keto reductase [Deferribacteraceae bacterium]|jgi:aryl-alcohol dehydrogenase-like predicted oxidoreductase|nr:aldo/keto reductase [Deferribacteraceae bacterium]
MLAATLVRTGLKVNKDSFGALPLQRVGVAIASRILVRALDAGINFFDTARFYTDSEEKIGAALSARRSEFLIATKTMAKTGQELREQLETSLRNLKTDMVDLYQFHNPSFCPKPEDGSGLYEEMLKARAEGKIRFIGLTNHRAEVAEEAVKSGLYDTLQFPLNYLSSPRDIALAELCEKENVGFIAMKALSGGLITDLPTSRAWLARFKDAVPIWGIQSEEELDKLIAAMNLPAELNKAQEARIEKDRSELAGEFCRGCGYCMPCPAGIDIANSARMSLLLRRAPTSIYLSEDWQRKMALIENCTECGQCASRCPYGLKTPMLLKKNYADYLSFL